MRTVLATLLLAALTVATGCENGGGMDSGAADPGAGASASTDFAVVGAEDAFANVEPATLERDAEMTPVFDSDGSFHRSDQHPRHAGSHLREILERLDLSAEQLEQIRALMMSYRQSIRAALEGLRQVNRPIIEQANLERAEIVESFRNGEINREEARRQLDELNQRTREAIRNNPANEPFLEAICAAKQELFDGIRAVIGDALRDLWDAWYGGTRSIGCRD